MNLGAYTAVDGQMPPYISVNRDRDGSVTVDVRSAAVMGTDGFMAYGPTGHIRLSAAEWAILLAGMVRRSLEAS